MIRAPAEAPRLAWPLIAAAVLLTQAEPSLAAPAKATQAKSPPAAARKGPSRPARARSFAPFVLTAVRAEGSTRPQLVEAAARPFLGKSMAPADLQQLTDAVARAYERDRRLALYTVSVPEQDFAGGVLRLQVLEGWVDDVVIQGGKGRDLSLVKGYARNLTAERPLTRRTLERYVSLIKDIPGLDPQVQLLAGTRPGAVRVVVEVRPKPVQAALAINNRGTALLGRTQVQADLYLNSLLRQGDQTRFTVALPTDTSLFQLYSLIHSEPIGHDGMVAAVFGTYVRTNPKDTGLAGTAKALGGQLYYPIQRGYERSLFATFGLDGLNADNAFLGTRFSADHSRAARLGLIVSRQTSRRQISLAATASFGLPVLGANASDPEVTDISFAKLNLKAAYYQALGKAWVLRLTGAAQISGDRLPGSEQMALGGEEFGRAYEAAFVSGDRGYAGSAELAWRAPFAAKLAPGAEVYVFADDGKVWYLARRGLPTRGFQLASAGGGVRVPIKSKLLLQLEATRGLSDPFPALDRERWRGVFSVRSQF